LQTIPFNVIVEGMIDLTSRTTSELRNAQQELWKYKLLPLTQKQKKYLENFVSFLINNILDIYALIKQYHLLQNKAIINPQSRDNNSILDLKRSVTKIEPAMKSLFQEKYRLINANKVAFLPYPDMYLSIYFHSNRFQLRKAHNFLLTNTYIPRENLFLTLSSENKTCLVSAVTSCDRLTKTKEQGTLYILFYKIHNMCIL